jgi:ABC-type multidrug transport system fused ATPase/permease subunit
MGIFRKISDFIKVAKMAFGGYKWQIITLIVLGFLSGLLEGIGINALIPLFSFLTGRGNGETDAISRIIEKLFLLLHVNFGAKFLLIFIALPFILKALVMIVFSYLSANVSLSYEKNTRDKLMTGFLNASWPYLLQQKLGYLATILMTNVRTSSWMLGYISNTIMILASFIVYSIIAVNISWRLTLSTLLIGCFFFLFLRPVVKKIRSLSEIEESLNKKISHHINENIVGMKTVKIMTAVDKITEIGEKYFDQIKKLQIKTALLSMTINSLIQPISVIFIITIFAFSYNKPDFNLAILVAIIYLIRQMFNYFDQLQKNLMNINGTMPYLKIVLKQDRLARESEEINNGKENFKFNNSLELKKVNFSYDNKTAALSDINMKIIKGETLGIIGPSGSGKTTLVDLILRLFEPQSGIIFLDDVKTVDIDLLEWRKNIGYVSQDIFLMNGTIAENIKFHDEKISDTDMEKAAQMANIHDFIESCPEKFNTVIGERGVMLSNGQRQRIIIARVLARRPQLLILDEATSALDNESEVEIQKVLKNIKGKVTVLIIAHRLSTIAGADRLLVLQNGSIIEEGIPETLLKDRESYFYKVYNISQ